MPELPEVETIRRQLEPALREARIVDSWTFGTPKFEDAPDAVGGRIVGLRRRGKYLLIDLDTSGGPFELIVHLGMTGRLAIVSSNFEQVTGSPDRFDHLRATWGLEDGRCLIFDDVRRFGRVAVVRRGDHSRLPTLAELGPEPFDESFTPEHLRLGINRSSRAVKTQLLGQRIVAGIGNIYADEALWRAGVHPAARRVTRVAAERLRDAIREVLEEGIVDGGTTLRNYRDATGGSGLHQERLQCYGRYGKPCHVCSTTLRRVVIDARATTYCSSCQKR